MPFAMRERSFLIAPGRQALTALLLGAVLGLVGPFGSFQHTAAELRVPLWIGLVALNWLLTVLVGEALCRLPLTRPVPLWGIAAAAGLLGAVPGALFSYRAAQVFGPFELLFPSALVFYAYVAVLSVAICVPTALILHPKDVSLTDKAEAQPPAGSAPAAADRSPFLERIPPHLGRDLLAVQTEDHYLRVHTPEGNGLVLMRMRDAVAELAPLDGLRVHRSWWVARGAVERTARDGPALALRLRGGLSVPVARTQRRAVQDWLGD